MLEKDGRQCKEVTYRALLVVPKQSAYKNMNKTDEQEKEEMLKEFKDWWENLPPDQRELPKCQSKKEKKKLKVRQLALEIVKQGLKL
jgi:uncharacterized protein HemY